MLRQELEYFDAISKATRLHSHVTALRLDARARIEWIDERIAAYAGFNAADLLGHRFVDLLAPSQRRAVAELIERVLTKGGSVGEIAVTLLGRQGGEFPGRLAIAPILSDFMAHGAAGIFVRQDAATTAQCLA